MKIVRIRIQPRMFYDTIQCHGLGTLQYDLTLSISFSISLAIFHFVPFYIQKHNKTYHLEFSVAVITLKKLFYYCWKYLIPYSILNILATNWCLNSNRWFNSMNWSLYHDINFCNIFFIFEFKAKLFAMHQVS